eukprot:4722897-Karenia_brevis.AAC.1
MGGTIVEELVSDVGDRRVLRVPFVGKKRALALQAYSGPSSSGRDCTHRAGDLLQTPEAGTSPDTS